MKKKLTLLIALSILLIITCFSECFTGSQKTSIQEESSIISETTEEEPPLPLVAEEEESIEQQKTPIEIVVEEKVEPEIETIEFPEANQIWKALKEAGYNDYVCAGIMGNIMAEVGGGTLDFSRYAYKTTGSHYGICQWGGGRKRALMTKYGSQPNLEQQIEFLLEELNSEYYTNELNKDNFFTMTDEKKAAYSFAVRFERCSSKYYNTRKANATKAYNYFVNN